MEKKYNKFPCTKINGFDDQAWSGYENICSQIINKTSGRKKTVIAVDCYPGVLDFDILPAFTESISPALTINTKQANLSDEEIFSMIKRNLTDDRVRGVLSHHKLIEFFDQKKIQEIKKKIDDVDNGIILVYGVGACLCCDPDLIIYADLARWEIQLRYRRGEIANYCAQNYNEDFLRMYKRGFFVDWRVADRHKQTLFDKIDFLLDTNEIGHPKMITGEAFRNALKQVARKPFSVVPYFDEGPWGGQWMKQVCNLDKNVENFAWCFNCVPEENSLFLKFGETIIEIPSVDLVFYQPRKLLGEKVHARFGKEFPIRFDFLDTMQGGNLSLQVHPTTEYIQDEFGMHYTQDESYYLLDAKEGAHVYLGVKTGIDRKAMIEDLERAQEGEISFNAEKYINKIPAKKHDHFLIPAGTIHCSGAGSMVLEISATPYIFTFKLWDWDRLGTDGKPRPIHIEHGKNVINWDLQTDEIYKNHVNKIKTICESDDYVEEETGLHEREFIETRRHWFSDKVYHNTNGSVNVMMLVEGEQVIVESPSGKFEPIIFNYAEAFIIPASVGEYTVSPFEKGGVTEYATIKAFVR
ncbi:MAG: mannose-6-phosphate isomerase [Chlamydiae bacterium]|nr:MAG: mannose-6-phosphate isomerase [Chlamydiota bacterium]